MEVSPEKARELEPLIQNHKSHITRLEQVMRLLENEQARHLMPFFHHALQARMIVDGNTESLQSTQDVMTLFYAGTAAAAGRRQHGACSGNRGTCMVSSALLGVQVEPDDLGNLKDSMEHYLQDAAEPDFVEAGPLSYTPHVAVHRLLLGQLCAFLCSRLCRLQIWKSTLETNAAGGQMHVRGLAGVQDTLMYESLPLGEVDSRVGQFAKHDMKEKGAKLGEDAEAEDSEVRAPLSCVQLTHVREGMFSMLTQ